MKPQFSLCFSLYGYWVYKPDPQIIHIIHRLSIDNPPYLCGFIVTNLHPHSWEPSTPPGGPCAPPGSCDGPRSVGCVDPARHRAATSRASLAADPGTTGLAASGVWLQ